MKKLYQAIKFIIAIFAINLLLVACSAPVMQMQHINKLDVQYRQIGTLSVATFIDDRPPEERAPLPSMYVQPIKPVIYSGNAQPLLPEYLHQVIAQEAEQSGMFIIANHGEYKLSGRILSLKAGAMGGPFRDNAYMYPGFPEALFQPYEFAQVSLYAVLTRNGKIVLQKPITLKMFRETPTGFGQAQDTRHLAEFFDYVITLAAKQLLQEIGQAHK